MIIVSMGAGLGNQMYEYAFYLHLKELYPNIEIKVDTKYAFPVAHNGIEIFDIFNLKAYEATIYEVRQLTKGYCLNGEGFNANRFIQKIRRKLNLLPKTMRVQRDFTEFYPTFLNFNSYEDIYFLGPFANYYYFKDIEKKVKETYKFPEINDARNTDYKRRIENSNSISIHIRKGDYEQEGIQLTSREFYGQAVREIERQVENAKFFIFTDDKTYARELFPDKDKFVIVEGNSGKNSFRDMQLMSLCKHNITANSTFSFWGAFLNSNPNKIVISPNLPFTGGKYPFVCDEWILI